jgi:hypothetical protein
MVILVLFAGCDNNDGADNPVKFSIAIGGPFGNGTINVKDDLREAAKGKTITLIASPANYFHLSSITVKGEKSDEVILVSGDGNERNFVMPAEPVKVTAASFQLDTGVYNITMAGQYYNGYLTSTDGNRYNAGYAREGETVTLLIVSDDGYYLSSVRIVGKTTEEPIPPSSITIDNENNRLTFTMPADDVIIPDYNNGPIFLPIE